MTERADTDKPMRLNTMQPAAGAKRPARRVGRGHGSGKGGTCGRGTKGQKSRSGSNRRIGFEGGQMPLQRRLPKRGFRSQVNRHSAEVRLNELAKVDGDVVDLAALRAAGIIGQHITRAKAILSGELSRALTVRGIAATSGARRAIEAAGGVVEPLEVEITKPAKLRKATKSPKADKQPKADGPPKAEEAPEATVPTTGGDEAAD